MDYSLDKKGPSVGTANSVLIVNEYYIFKHKLLFTYTYLKISFWLSYKCFIIKEFNLNLMAKFESSTIINNHILRDKRKKQSRFRNCCFEITLAPQGNCRSLYGNPVLY